jgi:hypothetical protein
MAVVPDDFYDGVGRVVVTAAQMEMQLGELVAAIGGPLTTYLTRGQPFGTLGQMLEGLLQAEHLEPELSAQISSALRDAKALQAKRDAVVHGLWQPDESGRRVAYKPKRYKIVGVPHPFSIEQLRDLAHDLAVMSSRLFALGWNVDAPSTGMSPMPIPDDLRDRLITGHRDLPSQDD